MVAFEYGWKKGRGHSGKHFHAAVFKVLGPVGSKIAMAAFSHFCNPLTNLPCLAAGKASEGCFQPFEKHGKGRKGIRDGTCPDGKI